MAPRVASAAPPNRSGQDVAAPSSSAPTEHIEPPEVSTGSAQGTSAGHALVACCFEVAVGAKPFRPSVKAWRD